MKTVLTLFGTRPEIIKLAPIVWALEKRGSRQGKLQPVGDDEHGRALAEDRQPAQADKRVEPQMVDFQRIGSAQRRNHNGAYMRRQAAGAKPYFPRGLARLVACASIGFSGQTCLG